MFCLASIPNLSALKISFKSYFERSVGNVVSFIDCGFVFTTDYFEADVMPEEKNSKMKNFFEKSRINFKLGNNYMM